MYLAQVTTWVIVVIAVLAIAAFVFAVVGLVFVKKALDSQKQAIQSELELFTPWYRDNPQINLKPTTGSLPEQIAKDFSRSHKVICLPKDTEMQTFPVKGKDSVVEANRLAEALEGNTAVLDQCHQGAMADASAFLLCSTGCVFANKPKKVTFSQIESGAQKAQITQTLVATNKLDSSACGYVCDAHVSVDLARQKKEMTLPIQENGKVICTVKVQAQMNGAVKRMRTGADFLTRTFARLSA